MADYKCTVCDASRCKLWRLATTNGPNIKLQCIKCVAESVHNPEIASREFKPKSHDWCFGSLIPAVIDSTSPGQYWEYSEDYNAIATQDWLAWYELPNVAKRTISISDLWISGRV